MRVRRPRIVTNQKQQQGFTLVELLVVIGIIGILMAVTIVAINPIQQFQNARNAQRRSDIANILDAIYQYEATNTGTIPPTLAGVSTSSGSPSPIATSGSGFVNPCTDLTPNFMADIPLDPSSGTKTGGSGTTCSATSYTSGYTIYKTGTRFTVTAPSAENGATITAIK
ncbi:MAG: type II secretion system protein [Candidatus Saccharimonadales bacterium]